MKILKIFGVVVGIHVFALILIFANPGCSSASKPAPSPSDTIAADPAPTSTATIVPPPALEPSITAAPAGGDAVAVVRFSPTRPGTAAATTLEAAPVADVTPATAYTIAKGDSLWSVAKKNHLTVSELASANNLKPGSTVRVGQKLIIPGKALPGNATHAVENNNNATATAAAPAPAKASRETVRHVVKPGETLGAIARKYQVKVGEIATANNISDPARIRPGMELVIPGWQNPAAKSSRPAEQPAPAAAPVPTPSFDQPAPAAADSVPTIVIPAPEAQSGDLDSGVKPNASEPPVIKVDDSPSGKL
jgi:LysM repeat protein